MAYLYPWGNTQQLNLDWILQKIKALEAGASAAVLDEISNALLAASYSAQAYEQFDIVFRDGKLYLANVNIPAPGEAWTPAHWDEILLGGPVSALLKHVTNLSSDNVINDSQVTGDNVSDALDTLKNAIDNISLDSDNISNESQVTGDNVSDALDNLNTAIGAEATARANADSALQGQITVNVETSTTSSKAYSAGDFLILNGVLYKVKTSIASGATLTIGTNIEATTVTESFTKVKEETCFASTNPTKLTVGDRLDITLDYPQLSYIGFSLRFYSTSTAQSAHSGAIGEFRAISASDHTASFYMDGQLYTITYAIDYSTKKFIVTNFTAPNLYVHRIFGIVVN